jgi:hypothetical protein
MAEKKYKEEEERWNKKEKKWETTQNTLN